MIRTPLLCGQFPMHRQNSHTFPPKNPLYNGQQTLNLSPCRQFALCTIFCRSVSIPEHVKMLVLKTYIYKCKYNTGVFENKKSLSRCRLKRLGKAVQKNITDHSSKVFSHVNLVTVRCTCKLLLHLYYNCTFIIRCGKFLGAVFRFLPKFVCTVCNLGVQ